MDQLVGRELVDPRFSLLLVGIFATLATSIAIVGVYGVMSLSVAQRSHEWGVRRFPGVERLGDRLQNGSFTRNTKAAS